MCEYCDGEERNLIPYEKGGKYNGVFVCGEKSCHPYLEILADSSSMREVDSVDIDVEINFCPMCGRKLGGNNADQKD